MIRYLFLQPQKLCVIRDIVCYPHTCYLLHISLFFMMVGILLVFILNDNLDCYPSLFEGGKVKVHFCAQISCNFVEDHALYVSVLHLPLFYLDVSFDFYKVT